MFGELGLDVDKGLAYRQLQAMGGCALGDVEHILGVRPGTAAALIDDLGSWGLVTVKGDRVVPTPLASVVGLTRQAEAAAIDRRRSDGMHSARRLRHVIADALRAEEPGSDQLRIVRGGKAVESELIAATILCVREDLSAVDTVVGEGPSETGIDDDEVDSILRRRTSRELGLRGADHLAGSQQRRLANPVRHGATYRCSTATPMRMEIFDRRVAFLPIDPDQPAKGAYVVRAPAVLAVLCRIFFDLWAGGDPLALPQAGRRHAGLTDLQLRILSGLAEGHTDERIARSLAVSRSTVTRAVRDLQSLVHTESRFQLAVRATREGWLDAAGLEPT